MSVEDWIPDKLAKRGAEHGRLKLLMGEARPCYHLLKWSHHRWQGSLLVYVEVRLKCIQECMDFIGASSYEKFIKQV